MNPILPPVLIEVAFTWIHERYYDYALEMKRVYKRQSACYKLSSFVFFLGYASHVEQRLLSQTNSSLHRGNNQTLHGQGIPEQLYSICSRLSPLAVETCHSRVQIEIGSQIGEL